MELAYTPDQLALQSELREYFARIVTPEVADETAKGELGGSLLRGVMRRMGADGILGLGWPPEYGGRGLGPIEQFIFYDEAQRSGAPVPFLTINTVGPTIMQFGTEAQKQDYLPRILRGEITFAIGYSEPNAGTDLASLQTKADKVDGGWVINGAKVFTSMGDDADYVWLAVRTDQSVKKHKGISIMIVPTSAPGYKWTPIVTLAGAQTTATFYEDLFVPDEAVVGGVNSGWTLIVNQLNFERVSLAPPGMISRVFDDVVRWAKESGAFGKEWVRVNLARVHAGLEVLKLMNWKVAWSTATGSINPADASATKVFGTNLYVEAYRLMLEVVGANGTVRRGSPEAVLAGKLERAYRGVIILTFGGGTNEVQRDLISVFGLQMPRPLR
jgi:hypothetical protein